MDALLSYFPLAVSRELSDIPAMTVVDAACALNVGVARVARPVSASCSSLLCCCPPDARLRRAYASVTVMVERIMPIQQV